MKVAIAGYGIEGERNYQYFADAGNDVTIVDEAEQPDRPLPEGAKTLLGAGVFEQLDGFDMVVRTAGLTPHKIKTTGKVWSATNEFFAQCPVPIIGVTGTKGKGTTASLIAEILRASGQKVHVVGNIGVPALEALEHIEPTDVVIYELSSFQLWDLERSPAVAVVLMIEPDHLDVHRDMDEYVEAKANIALHQRPTDTVIYHPTNEYSRAIAEKSPGHHIRYYTSDDKGVYIKSNTFFVQETALCSVDALQIPGRHNQENACAAITTALVAGANPAAVEAGLRAFQGLPHRLKYAGTLDGVEYYDDSIATTPGSAIAALEAFDGHVIMILGGSDKGVSYQDVLDACAARDATVVAIGQTGEAIARQAAAQGIRVERVKGGMKEVVETARRLAQPGDTVVLSPASASFDQYKQYSDRGEQFVACVQGASS